MEVWEISVIVKGMKMPKSCPCKLVGVGYDMYCSFTFGIPSRKREYRKCCEKKTRPNWCPLADVPPHGDLIDRDELKENGDLVNEEMGLYSYQGIAMDSINSARAVIKAEE